ncbi:MAG: hypothetical protein R3E13_05755 [Alphaproteobacteria bacterium]
MARDLTGVKREKLVAQSLVTEGLQEITPQTKRPIKINSYKQQQKILGPVYNAALGQCPEAQEAVVDLDNAILEAELKSVERKTSRNRRYHLERGQKDEGGRHLDGEAGRGRSYTKRFNLETKQLMTLDVNTLNGSRSGTLNGHQTTSSGFADRNGGVSRKEMRAIAKREASSFGNMFSLEERTPNILG